MPSINTRAPRPPRRTTITLPDDLRDDIQASGLPLVDIIRRGLRSPGDSARHTATEHRLTMIETRMLAIEQHQRTELGTIPAPDEAHHEGELVDEDHYKRRAEQWHEALTSIPEVVDGHPITARQASMVTGWPVETARGRLDMMCAWNLTARVDDGKTPHRWMIKLTPEQSTTSA